MVLYYLLNRTDNEVENFPYYEYQILMENYVDFLFIKEINVIFHENYVDFLNKKEELQEGKQKLL